MYFKLETYHLKYALFLIFFLYSLFIFGIYFFSENINSANFTDGYILGGDSSRYIEGGVKLSNFELPRGRSLSYIGYIFFISIFFYFKINLTFVVVVQIFLTIISAICLYKISKKFSSEIGGLFTISLYLFYFPLQIRNFYILTETLFICTIIFIIYLMTFFKKKNLILLIFFTIFASALRPHGVIIIPSILLAFLLWAYLKDKKKIIRLFFLCGILMIYPVFFIINESLENSKIIRSIVTKGIIWGYENEKNFIKYNYNDYSKNDLFALIIFIKENLFNFSLAIFKKITYFFIRVRPYYSDLHNFYLIFFNILTYPLAIFGIVKINSNQNLGICLIYSVIGLMTISISLTFVDWSGRFSLYILPLVFIFSGIGLNTLYKNILKKKFI